MKNQNIQFFAGLFLLAIFIFLLSFLYAQKNNLPFFDNQIINKLSPPQKSVEKIAPPPTKTPQEVKVLSNVKDYQITINKNGFSPNTVKIKAYDQVIWTNKDQKTHNVKGENWGNINLLKNSRYLQPFNNKGTYRYYCSLHPKEKGIIIVK